MTQIAWAEAESSNIGAHYFDEKSQTICIRFNNGGLYVYSAPHDRYVDFINSPSMGSYLHNVLKAYPFTRMADEEELIAYLEL